MHARLILLLLFLFPAVASATETIDPARIVSAATGDWDKDGDSDLALIVRPAEGSDHDNGVYVYLTGDNGALELKSAIPNKIRGQFDLAGQAPSVSALPTRRSSLRSPL